VTLSQDVELRIRRATLENAIAHDGTAQTGPVVGRLLATDASLRPRAEEVRAFVSEVVAELRGLPVDELEDRLASLGGSFAAPARPARTEAPDFPDLLGAVQGKVVLRLAPFPSGVLHIGNSRMLFVNQYYRERYDGKLLLAFDDTVGSAEKRIENEFFELIQGDLELVGIHPDGVYYKSDRIPIFYGWARRVIEKGAAYVCRCSQELLGQNRAAGRACPERSQTVTETLEEWEKMLGNAYGVGEATLRLRTDMSDPDPAFRDRVLFRISDIDHPRVGTKYRVWPMLEFAWAADDIELGVTHVLRGKDLVMEDRMEEYVWNVLGITGPQFLHWGILRVREAKVAKSKSYREVKSGLYDGFADPRTWSLRSLVRRGISMDVLRQFILSFGMSLADIEVPAETLYAENRKRIDGTSVRRAFVADPIRVEVEEYPFDLSRASLPNHPDRPELGERSVVAGPTFFLAHRDIAAHPGEEVRLKDLVNIRLDSSVPPVGGSMRATFTSRENRKLPRLQWVGSDGGIAVDLLGLEGDHTRGIGESALATASPGDIVQFERVGFVRIETDWSPGSTPLRVVYGHP